MGKKKRKSNYEPPRAVDLSALGVNGQVDTMGACKPGQYPYYNCVSGPGFFASCVGGTTADTSACGPGGYHTYPTCRYGSNAATVCLSGANQQW